MSRGRRRSGSQASRAATDQHQGAARGPQHAGRHLGQRRVGERCKRGPEHGMGHELQQQVEQSSSVRAPETPRAARGGGLAISPLGARATSMPTNAKIKVIDAVPTGPATPTDARCWGFTHRSPTAVQHKQRQQFGRP